MIKDAFNAMVNFQGRTMTISRPGTSPAVTGTAKFCPSNFYRHIAVENDIVAEGNEFIMTSDDVAKITGLVIPRRGDLLADTQLGKMTIDQVRPMYGVGGMLIGYRLRTTE